MIDTIRPPNIERLLLTGTPWEYTPVPAYRGEISDRDWMRMQARASQTWQHLSVEERATIEAKWLKDERPYERLPDGRPARG